MIVDVADAAERIASGEVVAYPTETVYGLGVDATSPEALQRLFRLKGREARKGVSVLVEDVQQLLAWADPLPRAAERLARRFWPGPLTLVVPVKAPELAAVRTADGVGFRCSSHPTARALVRCVGRPVVATSCNRAGEPPCETAADVCGHFGTRVAIVGGEPAGGGAPSSVVAVAPDGSLRILRDGAIPREALGLESSA